MCALSAGRPAGAQPLPGVALRWDHCFGEGTGVEIRSFACNTNAGLETLVGSFALPASLSGVNGNEIVVDVFTGVPIITYSGSVNPVPAWWQFKNAGSCRQYSLTAATAMDPDNQVCQDWASGQATGFLAAYQLGPLGPNTARIVVLSTAAPGALAELAGGAEYYSFTLHINHQKSVGDGACGGCDQLMTLILGYIFVTTADNANNTFLSGPLDASDSNIAVWRPGVVPVRATGWAALKSRFR